MESRLPQNSFMLATEYSLSNGCTGHPEEMFWLIGADFPFAKVIAESALQSKALGDENNFFAACAAELRLPVGEQTAEIAAGA